MSDDSCVQFAELLLQTGPVAEAGRCLAEAIPAPREMRMRPALEHAERRQATANARTRSNYLVGLTARERDVTWGAACGDLARIAGETRHADGSRSSTAVAGGGSAVGAQARTPVNSRGMGASHAVISLGDLSRSSFDDEYFRSAGITWPEALCGARNPTPREVRRVLRSLGGYHIEYDATGHSLDVTISISMDAQDWAVIWVENYAGLAREDKPLPLSFHRGNEPLVLRIMSEIAKDAEGAKLSPRARL